MKKISIFIFAIFLVHIIKTQFAVDSGTYHKHPKIIRNCLLDKLGHLRALRVPFIHPVVASIAIYKCFDLNYLHKPQIGYLFVYRAYWSVKRDYGIGGGFVKYINGLMQEKQIERQAQFNEIKTKLYSSIQNNVRDLLNQLENELTFLSSSNMNTPAFLINQKEHSVDQIMNGLNSILSPEKKQLLLQFKESKLNLFIPDDLNLISNAMGRNGDLNEITEIAEEYELILESNINNIVTVYLNNIKSTRFIKNISCGKYSFQRFLGLLFERYFPTQFKFN